MTDLTEALSEECTCMSRGNSCGTCMDTIGWDPEFDCPSCPVHKETSNA